jgi:4-aminobutyrate aminotransferase-like enzyme
MDTESESLLANNNVVSLRTAAQPSPASAVLIDETIETIPPFIDMHPPRSVSDFLPGANDTIAKEEEALLELEDKVCSHGDTVHYAKKPKIFAHCSGSYLYDSYEMPYLDLQMWYSAVNLGYGNQRINNALKKQIDQLPQLACQYLHKEKIELSAKIVGSAKNAFGEEGRVHFNVGGSQAV